MTIVKIDERGRIQLPHEVREAWNLRSKQPLVVELHGDCVAVSRLRVFRPESDPLLKEFSEHPLKGGKVSKKLLDEIEAWNLSPEQESAAESPATDQFENDAGLEIKWVGTGG